MKKPISKASRSLKAVRERASSPNPEVIDQDQVGAIAAHVAEVKAKLAGDVHYLAAITIDSLDTVSEGLSGKRTKGTVEYDQGLLAECKLSIRQMDCAHEAALFREEMVKASGFLCNYGDRALSLHAGDGELPADLTNHVKALVAPHAALAACLRIASQRMDADIDDFPPGLLTAALEGLEFLGAIMTGLQKSAAGLRAMGVEE